MTKCFFAEAEQMSGTKYYFTRDYLGGIREMTHSKGALCALYDNDLFGALLFAKSIRCSVLSLRRGFLFADESTLAPELGWHRYDREIPLRGCWRAGAATSTEAIQPPTPACPKPNARTNSGNPNGKSVVANVTNIGPDAIQRRTDRASPRPRSAYRRRQQPLSQRTFQ